MRLSRVCAVGLFVAVSSNANVSMAGLEEGVLLCPAVSETVVPGASALPMFAAESCEVPPMRVLPGQEHSKPSVNAFSGTSIAQSPLPIASPFVLLRANPDPLPAQAHSHIPLVLNDHVQAQIDLFQTRIRERFGGWLSRSGQYLPMMQGIFREKKLPEDLVYLALIESGFHPKAHSPADAVGPWQFIKSTGQRYGLRVNKWIDERRDPVKSTLAAAAYLQDLYGLFQTWTLSMAAYNAGEGRIMRALASTDARDFWELRDSDHIRDETKAYVPKFMAATMIAKNPRQYGFFVNYQAPARYEEVTISTATPLGRIAKAAGVSIQEIQALNPELKQSTTPPAYPKYRLKLPLGSKQGFLEKFTREKVVEKAFKAIKKTKPSLKKKYKIVSKKKIKVVKKVRKYRMTKAVSKRQTTS